MAVFYDRINVDGLFLQLRMIKFLITIKLDTIYSLKKQLTK